MIVEGQIPELVKRNAGERSVRWLANADVMQVLDMGSAIEALRAGYSDLLKGDATYIPRADIFVPTGRPTDYYQWGSMTGGSVSSGVVATRMKSDLASWPGGNTWEKHCVGEGTYCGLIFLFSIDDGAPVCVIQDGYLQHVRVGASAGIGTDYLARKDAASVGLVGSGGMARTYLEAICHVRSIKKVSVFSPNSEHRKEFAHEMSERLGIDVSPVNSAEEAVRLADIVVSATDSAVPTLDHSWISPGTHIVCVTRRELSKELVDKVDNVIQLGVHSIPPGTPVPDLIWTGGAVGSYLCGSSDERARVPKSSATSNMIWPTLVEAQAAGNLGRENDDDITLFINTGTQGLQFASVGSLVWRRAEEKDLGWKIPLAWFLQDIRD